jgi:hypothetical protein
MGEADYKHVDVFKPRPWQKDVLDYTGELLLLTGSAGGGKSRVAGEKVHAFLLAFPGATAFVARKTKASMYNSTVAFFRKEIFPRYISLKKIRHNATFFRFEYDNGSMLVYGGMKDDAQKEAIRSIGGHGGIDICWMEEATQFVEADFNEIVSRMRGNAAPWRQIILTTNPEGPTHWIYQRFFIEKIGKVKFSHASDNPYNPADYVSKLDRLTGIERDRLRDGLWKEAGGRVLDQWRPDAKDGVPPSVTKGADFIPNGGPVFWWVDDGYSGEIDSETGLFRAKSHPRTFLFVQQRSDGTLAIFDESYEVQMLAPEHINEMIIRTQTRGYGKPSKVVYDRAAASLGGYLRDELGREWRLPESAIVQNRVPVDDGNKEVNTWLGADDNGVRRLIAHPRCKFLALEMLTYAKDPRTGRVIKDFDHGPDAIRMGIWDLVYGKAVEVDVSGGFELDLEQVEPDDHGIYIYDDGDVSIAAAISMQSFRG